MKYYVYISDSKVKMLLPQIRSPIKKISPSEFKLSIGMVGAAIQNKKTSDNIYTLVDNLREIERYLRKKGNIIGLGEFASEGDWISGECLCYSILLENNPAAILFIGEENDTIFALGGSSRHLIGNAPGDSVNIGWSFLPGLLRALNSFHEHEGLLDFDCYPTYPEQCEQWYEVIKLSLIKCKRSNYPPSRLEFLARILLTQKIAGKHFHLATPLYVSSPARALNK